MSIDLSKPGQTEVSDGMARIQDALPRSQGTTAEPITDVSPSAMPSYVNPGTGLDDTTTLVQRAISAGVEAGAQASSSKSPSPLMLAAIAVGLYFFFKRKVAL